jgi:hypothetical protein
LLLLIFLLSCKGVANVLIAQIINISEKTISDWRAEADRVRERCSTFPRQPCSPWWSRSFIYIFTYFAI